jgi:hypothetical protein
MRKVHFLSERRDKIGEYLLFPIRVNRKQLRERGLDVRIFYDLSEACLSCDVLCLVSKPTMRLLGSREPSFSEDGPVLRFIERARSRCQRIIWFDNSDSTTVTHFEILPYVDAYLKKQLFDDFELYRRPMYGGRIFTEFYHEHFGIEDDVPFTQFFPLDPEFEDKVDLSWHIGLADMAHAFGTIGALQARFPQWMPAKHSAWPQRRPIPKQLDLFLRTTSDMGRPTVSFHRQEMIRGLQAAAEHNGWSANINGPRLPRKDFEAAMASSRIMPSPFGWGEIGVRDFEAILYGAVLLKPQMSHMRTWPDVFVEGETYEAVSWDFTDLEAKIAGLLDDDRKQAELVSNAQQAYADSVSPQGMEAFCTRFAGLMEDETRTLPESSAISAISTTRDR